MTLDFVTMVLFSMASILGLLWAVGSLRKFKFQTIKGIPTIKIQITKYETIRIWCGLLAFVLLSSFFIVLALAFAAENPVPPAPATPPAVAEKPAVSCPTEFNIDDSAWAMHQIKEPTLQKIAEGMAVVERVRIFSYIPDPEQRIWVHIKKLMNPDCAAALYSYDSIRPYGSIDDVEGKRILGVIKAPGKITVFLLTEKGWESGDDWETFATDCGAKGCNLTFALYRNKELVASRTLFIKQFSHFREPVE